MVGIDRGVDEADRDRHPAAGRKAGYFRPVDQADRSAMRAGAGFRLFRAVIVREVGERLRCGGNDEVPRGFELDVPGGMRRRSTSPPRPPTSVRSRMVKPPAWSARKLRRGQAGGDDLVRRAVGERGLSLPGTCFAALAARNEAIGQGAEEIGAGAPDGRTVVVIGLAGTVRTAAVIVAVIIVVGV